MKKESLHAKKSLGQNFLTSEGALASIIEASSLSPHEVVLEIGPGTGTLTEKLLEHNARVIAVEKDDRLIPFLRERFKDEIREERLVLIHEDILNFNPVFFGLTGGNYKIIANIPYYITGELIRKFLEGDQPTRMVLLVQKEVAERIVARDGKESMYSISIKAYGNPQYIKTVKRGSFSPAPGVDSAILLIKDISKNFFTDCDENDFFKIVKSGFAHKRKQLGGNLSDIAPKEEVLHALKKLGIPGESRAEDLTLEQWKKITQEISLE